MNEYSIRKASLEDVDFIATVIIEAEKSMTNNFGLANFFGLSESNMRKYLIQILNEDVDGCEMSLSSFYVACYEGKPVSALGGWLEGFYDGMPSAILKANLIAYFLPIENVQKARERADLIRELQIEREIGTYQLEYSYTADAHRGNHLIQKLMVQQLEHAKELDPNVKKAQLHVYENNTVIIKVHERSGFHIAKRYESHNPKVIEYYPDNVELLMEKEL